MRGILFSYGIFLENITIVVLMSPLYLFKVACPIYFGIGDYVQSSSLKALTEPYLIVSHHTALIAKIIDI